MDNIQIGSGVYIFLKNHSPLFLKSLFFQKLGMVARSEK